jgi:predicted extracellular nuclease
MKPIQRLSLLLLTAVLGASGSPHAVSPDVLLSQVYGGGGNSGSTFTNDFIELYNAGPLPVDVTGWTVQYASAQGTGWQSTTLSGTIQPGQYYLVQEAAGTGGTTPLPTPDAVGTIAMSATAGKVALVAGPTLLTGACPDTGVLDLVGYGGANCFEGTAPAPVLSSTLAAARRDGGPVDTDDNAADFAGGSPFPRSTAGVPPTGTGASSPASVSDGAATLLTISVAPGAFPSSPVTEVRADLSPIGGGSQPFFDDGTNGDLEAGDAIYSYRTVVSGTPGFRVISASISDARGRSGTVGIRLAVEPEAITPIASIQGSGAESPLTGQFVTTSGVVTAVRSNGFYLQTPDEGDDLDAATSEGLFVFTGAAAAKPAVGGFIRVTGFVSEFAPAPPDPPVTELTGPPVFADIGAELPLPEPVVLDSADTPPGGSHDRLERLEGMRVSADLRVIAPTEGTVFESSATAQSNGVFYAVLLGLARPVREPGLDPAVAPLPDLPCCVPQFDGNPERLRIGSGVQAGSGTLDVAAGQRVSGLTGVLDFAFGSYTILPDPGAGTVIGARQAAPVPEARAGEFTVASANLERFFDEHDDPVHDDAVLTGEAVELRLRKASLMVRRVLRSPDVLGVVEVENLSILQRLAARINADAVAEGESDPMYVAYLEEGNDIGGIDSGFLVSTSRVDVIGVEQHGRDTTYTPPGAGPGGPLPLLNDRPPLVLTAAVRAPTPLPITIIVNHLRSLSGIDGPDGERIRAKRRAQAEFLASLIQARQGTERVISVGDYNAFPFNDGLVDVVGTIRGMPSAAESVLLASPDLVEPDLTNLGDWLKPAQRYSFVFEGNAQALDHILVNRLALQLVTRTAYARGNADFPESLRSDPSRPERISDHDAAIAYFRLPRHAGRDGRRPVRPRDGDGRR